MNRSITLVCITAVLTTILPMTTLGSSPKPDPRAPNILLILVDDMSYNGISCYGEKPWSTPNIDRLAENGMKWTDAYAYPVCSPTRVALLTGRNPVRTGITNWIPGWAERTDNGRFLQRTFPDRLPLSEFTVAEALKAGGYETALVGKWHVGDGPVHSAVQQGFDHAYSVAAGNTGRYFVRKEDGQILDFGPRDEPGRQIITEHLVDKAINWLDQRRGEAPWFLYFSTHVVHKPITAKDELVEKWRDRGLDEANPDSAAYAAMHEHMDTAIGRLLDHVDQLGPASDTIILFLSDNGGRQPETDNTPFRGGKGELLEGGVRVPLLVQWPGRIQAGSVSGSPTVVDDILPTLVDLSGLPPVTVAEIDGMSLAPVLLGSAEALEQRPLFFHYPHYTGNPYGEPSSAIRKGKWKLIHRQRFNQPELYDLEVDPGEVNDLAGIESEIAEALLAELDRWKAGHGIQPLEPNPDYDPTRPTTWNGQLQAEAEVAAGP